MSSQYVDTQRSSAEAPVASTQLDLLDWRSFPWPAVSCWLAFLLLSILCVWLDESNWLSIWNSETLQLGWLMGQFAVATIIAGLTGKSWITGWFLAILLACIETVALVLVSLSMSPSASFWQQCSLCSLWPVLLLATCAPLVLLRTLCGWTLVRCASPAIARTRSSLEDLVLMGVIIACSITLAQLFLNSGGPQDIRELLIAMAILSSMSLLCVPITVYVTFRSRTWLIRLLGWTALTGLAFCGTFVVNTVLAGNWREALDSIVYTLVGVGISCAAVAIAMIALMMSGYRLTYYVSLAQSTASTKNAETVATAKSQPDALLAKPAPSASWLDDSEQQKKATSESLHKRPTRLVTGIVMTAAVVSSIGIQLDRQRFSRFYAQLAKHDLVRVDVRELSIEGLQFSPSFQLNDLQKFSASRASIKALSLAGTGASDEVLEELSQYPVLKTLDLSGTAITDEGLLQSQLFSPRDSGGVSREPLTLSLADTKVSWSTARQLAERTKIYKLNLAGLGITDQQLTEPIAVRRLSLARNPITDDGLASLLSQGNFNHLDLTDTQITGECLVRANCPEELILDGTQITDATLTKILRRGVVKKISLARTKITAALLPKLNGLSVRLGQGLISDNDIAQAGPLHFEQLALNDKQFTGFCLTNINLITQQLDLSGSSITDDEVQAGLTTRNWHMYLGLANTQVTDRSLPRLRGYEVDVRGTRITADGLLGTRGFVRFIISHDQFSPAQMAKLQQIKIWVNGPIEYRETFE